MTSQAPGLNHFLNTVSGNAQPDLFVRQFLIYHRESSRGARIFSIIARIFVRHPEQREGSRAVLAVAGPDYAKVRMAKKARHPLVTDINYVELARRLIPVKVGLCAFRLKVIDCIMFQMNHGQVVMPASIRVLLAASCLIPTGLN